MKMQFLRDAYGYPRCEVGPPHAAVDRFLREAVCGWVQLLSECAY